MVAAAAPSAVLACVADVHGNTAALDAVLAWEDFARAGAVVFLGCPTTGPDPRGVLERCADLTMPVFHRSGRLVRSAPPASLV